MSRLSSPHMNPYVREPDRRQGARRLQDMGLTPLGAHQVMHGQLVTDPGDRERIAEILFEATAAAPNSSLKV